MLRRAVPTVLALCMLLTIGADVNVGTQPLFDDAPEPRRRGIGSCAMEGVKEGVNAATGGWDCNWRKRDDVRWVVGPVIRGGVLIAEGALKSGSEPPPWSKDDIPSGEDYYSPFLVFADCNRYAAGSILPPLEQGRSWTLDDPDSTVATVWDTDARSFRIRAPVPVSWLSLQKLEIHVGGGRALSTATPLSVAAVEWE